MPISGRSAIEAVSKRDIVRRRAHRAARVARWTRAMMIAGVCLAGSLISGWLTSPVIAAQHLNGSAYVHWSFDGPGDDLWNVDQEIRVDRKAPSTYWALAFRYTGQTQGGYMGVQTKGSRFDGSHGDTAIFSLWGADAARPAEGACAAFAPEGGTGMSCRMAFAIRTTTVYRLRLWRLERDGSGQWWGAWILSSRTGHDYHLGDLHVPNGVGTVGDVVNFAEYFGPARACDRVPVSQASFTNPAGNSFGDQAQTYGHYSRPAGVSVLSCARAGAEPFVWPDRDQETGLRLTLGGGARR